MQWFSIAYNMSLSLLCSGKTFGKTALKLIFIFFKHTECLSRRFSFFRATLMFSVSERETNCPPCSLPPHPTVSAEAVHQAAMISSCFLARLLDQSGAACAALAAAACALSRGLWPCVWALPPRKAAAACRWLCLAAFLPARRDTWPSSGLISQQWGSDVSHWLRCSHQPSSCFRSRKAFNTPCNFLARLMIIMIPFRAPGQEGFCWCYKYIRLG